MSERQKGPGLRTFLTRIIGIRLDPEVTRRLEKGLGTEIDDDPARWDDVKRKIASAAGEDPSVAETVDPVFERLLREATGGRRDGPVELQPNWMPGERAVLATIIEDGDPARAAYIKGHPEEFRR